MENASQALTIVAGILFALLIIGVLVIFYNNIRDWQANDEMLTAQEQADQFNKEYDVYIRDLYGSELLSLVNKVDDYNIQEAQDKGYSRLEVVVTFKSDIGGFQKNKKYTTDEIIAKIEALQAKIETYGSKEYGGKTVKQLSLMRTNELKQFISDKQLNKNPDKTAQIEADIKNYTDVKSDEVTIKSKMFKYVTSSYESSTGRMKQIEYKEQ